MTKAVCVFCASSNRLDAQYYQLAEDVGRLFAELELLLVYGGAINGMMGKMALACQNAGGSVKGIIPRILIEREVAYEDADELVRVADLYERKKVMIDSSDAFLVLPGGFGTLDEVMEVITLKQLCFHEKPILFLNDNGFFDGLFAYFDKLEMASFAPSGQKSYYTVLDHLAGLRGALL